MTTGSPSHLNAIWGEAPAVTGADAPARLTLLQNHPNPFNPMTTIQYSLARSARVALDIYDPAGHRIIRLVDAEQGPGAHSMEWDGRDGAGTPVASGVYFYRLTAGSSTETRKMVLLR